MRIYLKFNVTTIGLCILILWEIHHLIEEHRKEKIDKYWNGSMGKKTMMTH